MIDVAILQVLPLSTRAERDATCRFIVDKGVSLFASQAHESLPVLMELSKEFSSESDLSPGERAARTGRFLTEHGLEGGSFVVFVMDPLKVRVSLHDEERIVKSKTLPSLGGVRVAYLPDIGRATAFDAVADRLGAFLDQPFAYRPPTSEPRTSPGDPLDISVSLQMRTELLSEWTVGKKLVARLINVLQHLEIQWLGDVVQLERRWLARAPNCGPACIELLERYLAQYDLGLGMKVGTWSPPAETQTKPARPLRAVYRGPAQGRVHLTNAPRAPAAQTAPVQE